MENVAEQAMGSEMHKSLQEFWDREHRNQEKSTFWIARKLVLNGNGRMSYNVYIAKQLYWY